MLHGHWQCQFQFTGDEAEHFRDEAEKFRSDDYTQLKYFRFGVLACRTLCRELLRAMQSRESVACPHCAFEK